MKQLFMKVREALETTSWNTMMMMMMMFMSMRWDYVFELLPPPGLLFIPQVMCKNEEPWRNDIDRGKLLIRPQELSGCRVGRRQGRGVA
jgi:hypothetical protein